MSVAISTPKAATRGPTMIAIVRLLQSRSFLIGAVVVITIALIAVFADVLSPYDPLRNSFRTRLRPPDETFWFGTDHFGRDILSRVIHGARISLVIGLMTALLTGIAGTIIGAAADFFQPSTIPSCG